MFLDSMESSLSQEPRHMPMDGNLFPKPCLKLVFIPSVQVGHKGHFLFCLPPTLDDHIFHVPTSFGVFLDSMESPLSPDSLHMPMEGSGCPQPY